MADIARVLAAFEHVGREWQKLVDRYAPAPTPPEKEPTMPTATLLTPAVVEQLHDALQRIPDQPRTTGREHLRVRSREGVVVHDGTQPRYVAEWDVWHVDTDGTASLLSGHGTGAGALHRLPHLLHEVGLDGARAGGVHDAA